MAEGDGTREPQAALQRVRFAREVVDRLRASGHEAYWAGGCVRDQLLGDLPADYDVATSAPPEVVIALFDRTVPVGLAFGVVRVQGPAAAGEVEVATFRSDDAYIDGRRPVSVVYSSAEVDASRRDFTINGMFFDPIGGQVIDHVGGQADLKRRLIRAIGDPVARFAEDKLRLLRCVRFAARFGFEIEPATRAALIAHARAITVVAAERIAQELRRILVHPSRAQGVRLLADCGLLEPLLPELARLTRAAQKLADFTPSPWEQTLRCLDALPETPSVPLALAALWQDIGLTDPARHDPSDAHEEASQRHAQERARQLKLANWERLDSAWLIGHHHVLEKAEGMKASQLKPLLAHPGRDDLLRLHRAIATAADRGLDHVLYCERYLRVLPQGPLDPPPLIGGEELKRLGLPPGPRFAVLLERLRAAQLDNQITTPDEALAQARRWFEEPGV